MKLKNQKYYNASDNCRGIFFDDPLYGLPICFNYKKYDITLDDEKSISSSFSSYSSEDKDFKKCTKYFTGKESIYLCEKDRESFWGKTLDNSPSLVIALLAVCVSLSTLRFMSGQDNRNAMRSIDDEYILRRIISPNIIEPIFDLSREIIGFMSDVNTSANNGSIEAELKSYLPKLRAMQGICASLNVLPENFKNEINKVLEKLEDAIVTSAHEASNNRLGKVRLENTIGIQSNNLLMAVRKYQLEILNVADMPLYKKIYKRFVK